ncbi:hypothetical protein TNIN_16291 [Trichonephila inaurata madagascariensis]|uniref:Uncharacterized protein n=1 Tax=Trichonephila inaurata madagascariensis TaxID=2747483 RepID=A0A8X6XKY8_9ARAC|nr:hypothetical protein TNIN_16291 [Trichonephila inaurata madagascariensis]
MLITPGFLPFIASAGRKEQALLQEAINVPNHSSRLREGERMEITSHPISDAIIRNQISEVKFGKFNRKLRLSLPKGNYSTFDESPSLVKNIRNNDCPKGSFHSKEE